MDKDMVYTVDYSAMRKKRKSCHFQQPGWTLKAYPLYAETKKVKLRNRAEWWAPESGKRRQWGDPGQRVQTYSYKIHCTVW